MDPAKVILISLAIGLPTVILAKRGRWKGWLGSMDRVAIVLALGIVGAIFLPGTGDGRERPARFERSALLQSVRLLATLAFLMPMLAFAIFAILFGELGSHRGRLLWHSCRGLLVRCLADPEKASGARWLPLVTGDGMQEMMG